MGTAYTQTELEAGLKAAVERSLATISVQIGSEHLCGFALCTDDDVRTLYHVACTTEQCEASEEDEFRYLPVDWEIQADSRLFEELSGQLFRLADQASDIRQHREVLFEVLTSVLVKLRGELNLSDDVLLLVVSTDPGPHIGKLERAAAARLNTRELYEAWVAGE